MKQVAEDEAILLRCEDATGVGERQMSEAAISTFVSQSFVKGSQINRKA